jgi:hypothetical protein
VEATCSYHTYQDALTPLPGVHGVVAVVQGKAHVARVLQLPVGELNCKRAAQKRDENRRAHMVRRKRSVTGRQWQFEWEGKETQVLILTGTEGGPDTVGKRK